MRNILNGALPWYDSPYSWFCRRADSAKNEENDARDRIFGMRSGIEFERFVAFCHSVRPA